MVTGTVWGPSNKQIFPGGGGGALKGRLRRAGPPRSSTPNLFKTKIAYFVTLYKTGDTTF